METRSRRPGRGPLIVGWLAGFVLQAAVRDLLLHSSLLPSLAPATGVAALLFTFYKNSDPATTPERPGAQVALSLAVAAIYGGFMAMHVAFGRFCTLTIVCGPGALACGRPLGRLFF